MPDIQQKNPSQPLIVKPMKEYDTPPAEALKVSFDSASLPSLALDEGEGQVVNGEAVKVNDSGKVTSNDTTTEQSTKKITNDTTDKTATKATEEADNGIPKFLKPPSDKKDKANDKKVNSGDTNKKEVVAQITPKEKTGTFDYTGFSDSEIKVLKNMSNESKEYTAKLIKDNRELSKLKGSTYLQHPEGYTLSPEYKQMQFDVTLAEKEANIWQRLLTDVKGGKKIKPLINFDAKGNPVYGDELAPTDDLEEGLRTNMMAARQEASNRAGKLSSYPDKFKQIVEGDNRVLQDECAKRFAWVSKPEMLEYSVEIPGVGDKKLSTIRNDFVNLFPPYRRNSQEVDIAANLMIAMAIQGAELAELKAGKQQAETKLSEVNRAEPSSSVKPTSQAATINGVKEFSLAGMPE